MASYYELVRPGQRGDDFLRPVFVLDSNHLREITELVVLHLERSFAPSDCLVYRVEFREILAGVLRNKNPVGLLILVEPGKTPALSNNSFSYTLGQVSHERSLHLLSVAESVLHGGEI